jgi:ligand-binding sensor domain-containing protein
MAFHFTRLFIRFAYLSIILEPGHFGLPSNCWYFERAMRIIAIISFTIIISAKLFSQSSAFIFNHIDEKKGLSDNIVNCFLKDSRGIIWIGTYNGFNRFDGSNFYIYKKRKGSNSMLNEVVHSLCEDKKGNIWGSTDNGVFCYQPGKDVFTNYPIRSMGTGHNFYNIVCDKEGDIWAAGDWSVFRYSSKSNQFDETIKLTQHRDSLNFYKIRKNGLLVDPSGNGLWIATKLGLMYFDILKNSIQNFKNKTNDSLFLQESVSALSKSRSGTIWFFNNARKEIILFDPSSRKILKKINISATMPSADAATLFVDNNNRLWFSSLSHEMLVIDITNNKITRLEHKPDDQRTIGSDFFWAVLQDEDNAIWLGTHAGISRCNPERTMYNHLNLPQKINELKETAIEVAVEDPLDKSFWLFTRSSLLIHYQPLIEKYEVYNLAKAASNLGRLKPGRCNDIKFFRGNVVITTTTGSWQLERNSQEISAFNFLPNGFENFTITEIVFDGDSVVYFTDGKRLLYWNYSLNKSRLASFRYDSSVVTTISKPALTATHQLWMIASNTHIAFLDNEKKLNLVKIVKDQNGETGTLTSFDADSSGNIWVFNRGAGMYRYNIANKDVKLWNETDGLIGNRIRAGKIDNSGRAWTVLYNKISIYTSSTNRFSNFKIPYSESDLDYYNYISKRSNGNIFSTINNEIVEFFPERLFAKPSVKKPQISQLSVAGKDFQILFNDNIVLGPNENTVRFRFGILTDNEIFPYDLEYKLEGAEENWSVSGENHEASYNNLPPGDYTFRVKATGRNNTWQSEEAAFSFTIKTPFYKSTLFLVLIALLLCGIVFFTYRYRLAQKEKVMVLESKAQMLEKEKAMVMYESLKQHLNPHFLFNSLTSLRSLIKTDSKTATTFLDGMSKVYRYVLKSGEQELVRLQDELDFVKTFTELQQIRFKEGLQVKINIDESYFNRYIAPVTLQNLVENAIKHNTADKDSPLVIDIFIENNYVVVRNNLQRYRIVETSNKRGLPGLITLYRYYSDKPVEISEDEKYFTVKIPLL